MNMCKVNLYAKIEKLEAQLCRCTRQGLKSYALVADPYLRYHLPRKFLSRSLSSLPFCKLITVFPGKLHTVLTLKGWEFRIRNKTTYTGKGGSSVHRTKPQNEGK